VARGLARHARRDADLSARTTACGMAGDARTPLPAHGQFKPDDTPGSRRRRHGWVDAKDTDDEVLDAAIQDVHEVFNQHNGHVPTAPIVAEVAGHDRRGPRRHPPPRASGCGAAGVPGAAASGGDQRAIGDDAVLDDAIRHARHQQTQILCRGISILQGLAGNEYRALGLQRLQELAKLRVAAHVGGEGSDTGVGFGTPTSVALAGTPPLVGTVDASPHGSLGSRCGTRARQSLPSVGKRGRRSLPVAA
jgi:hypothetical protein